MLVSSTFSLPLSSALTITQCCCKPAAQVWQPVFDEPLSLRASSEKLERTRDRDITKLEGARSTRAQLKASRAGR
eukprot:2365-Heterococcus_DN1.PRE.4